MGINDMHQQFEERPEGCTCPSPHESALRQCEIHCTCWGNADLNLYGQCRLCGKYPLYH